MFELKSIFIYFSLGFFIAIIYEIVRLIKKALKGFTFSHILLDFTFFYFAICYIFINHHSLNLGNELFYSLSFASLGFALECVSLQFLIDKIFQFVYTKINNYSKRLKKSKFGSKIFK